MRINIVTNQFEGLTRRGGLGTAYRRLAGFLRSEGHEIRIIAVCERAPDTVLRKRIAKLQADKRLKGVKFLPLLASPVGNRAEVLADYSRRICDQLKKHPADLVHLPEYNGIGYHSLTERKAGRSFTSTRFIVGAHGSCAWIHDEFQKLAPARAQDLAELAIHSMERETIRLADAVVSPSKYMMRWLRGSGFQLPKEAHVISNINSLGRRLKKTSKPAKLQISTGLAFFGTLEPRKGIFEFTEALSLYLDRNPKVGTDQALPVLLIGKDTMHSGTRVSLRVEHLLRKHRRRLRIELHSGLSSEEAQRLLGSRREVLVCIPSVVDNLPYVVVEALELGLNFIVSDRGGSKELIHPADLKKIVFSPDPNSMRRMFEKKLFRESHPCRPSEFAKSANRSWSALHRALGSAREIAQTLNER